MRVRRSASQEDNFSCVFWRRGEEEEEKGRGGGGEGEEERKGEREGKE